MAPTAPGGRGRSDATWPVIAEPLLDTSPAGRFAAIDADSIGTRVRGLDLPHVEHLDADASWALGLPGDPFSNTVASAQFAEADADARIAEIVAAFDEQASPFLWWRAPFHGPADLAERLERAHVFPAGTTPAMAMDLARLGPAPATDGRFEIRGVRDEGGLRDFLGVLADDPSPEGVPPSFPPGKVEVIVAFVAPRLHLEPTPLRFVGYRDGRPVTVSRLSLAGGAAGLYAVATREEARGHGYGAAVSHRAIATGRDLGYRIATLQATDMGYPIYRRLGFVEQFQYAIHVHLPGGERFIPVPEGEVPAHQVQPPPPIKG